MNTPARFSDGQYKNWIKCSQSLIIMKEALHDYIDKEVTHLHCDIAQKVSSMYPSGSTFGNQCGTCSSKNIKLRHGTWHIKCNSNICDKWLQHILAVHNEPQNPVICWKNVDISKWPTERYHVAKVFMPKGQDRTTTMPKDLDAPAILSLLKYCNWFSKHLPNTQILSDLIDFRNKVLHSGDLRVVDSDKESSTDLMIQLLRDLNISGDAQADIQRLKEEDIDINFRETEIRVLKHMLSVMQTSQFNLLEEMKTLTVNITESTGKMDKATTDIEGIKKALEELKSISAKMGYFFDTNPDINEHKITETIRNISIDVQGLQRNLITLEQELKTKLFALEKQQEETKQQLEDTTHQLIRRIAALEAQLSLQKGQLEQSRQWDSLRSDNQQVSVAEMRRRIDHSKEVLKKHRHHAGTFFIENQRYKTGKKILDLHRKIIITGKAGQGKTYLAYQLLSKLIEDKTHVSPLIISSADEWMKLADPSTELGIVVDDMCGKYGLLQSELKKWNENVRFIAALIENGKHTVVFTMRTHIHEETAGGLQLESDISDPLIEKNTTLNLEGSNMALNEVDKIEFANRYLKERGLTHDEVLQLCRKNETSIGFPLLCRNAQSVNVKSELFDLFDRPLPIMLRELDRLCKDKSLIYGCLVLTMLLGGTLPLESTNEYLDTTDMENQIKLIFDSYAGPNVKLAEIQQEAKSLCGTYFVLSESNESYYFFHDTIEEAVFLSYGKLHLPETLKLCSLKSLCKLCRINDGYQDLNVIEATLMLDVPPKHHPILTERFVKALEKKNPRDFASIAEANVWSSAPFRNLFMDGCKKIHILEDKNQNTLLVHAANANNCDLAGELICDMRQICSENQQQTVSYLTEAAKASCIHKDICLFKQIIETGIVNVNDILLVTVEKGSKDAMEFLLQNGADINSRSKNGESLLHAACLHGRLNIIELLLSQTSLTVNLCDSRGRSVCHSAASGGSVDILEFLIARGANPLCIDIDGMNLLHNACSAGKKEMSFYLMKNYSIMLYSAARRGYTVPHVAAYGGCIDIFNKVCELINSPSEKEYKSNSVEKDSYDLKDKTKREETLLHTACLGGNLEMTKYLVEKYPDMSNEVNIDNASIAHAAAAAKVNNISVLQYLIDKGLNPWCRTATKQTLLHISCFSGQLKSTLYLLKKYPNMINEVDIVKGTPAHYAAQGGNVSVLKLLIDKGLKPRCKTERQETLLHKSCIGGQMEMTEYLLEKYPDMINDVDIDNGTPAHYAAESGKIPVLQYLIDKGLNPWCKTARQETLLHRSCMSGKLKMTKYLLEKYSNIINEVDTDERTLAHYAALGGNVSVLQYLIDKGLNPMCRTARQETLLHKSCIGGQMEMTEYLLEKYPDMINDVDIDNGTPAHYAAESGKIPVLQYLIDKGVNPWCRTSRQETLLHRSCKSGKLKMTKYLLEKYSNMINEVDIRNGTPAHYSALGGNVSVLQYLIDKGLDPWCRTTRQETLLHKSCIKGQLEMTHHLLEEYPNMINEVDDYQGTPAHYAALSGKVSVLQCLIDKGLNPWCRSIMQETLLHASCTSGQLEMTHYLLEGYHNMINEVDIDKGTPAHYAARYGNVSVLQFLIDQGLNPWCRTAKEETLLHKSCIKGQLGMTRYLLEKYPSMINEVDIEEGTPAHYAAQSSNVSVLQYLIDKGLNPLCRTASQETLLHKACISGQLDMTEYLLEKYPKMINEVDYRNGTPAHYAAQSANVSVVQCLIDKGLSPWCRTATQETLLHKSCITGQLGMTRYLLEKYPSMINEVDIEEGTPAHYAAHSSNVSVLQYLIDKGLNPLCRTASQETLLHMACISGQLDMTEYLLEKYPKMINEVDYRNGTPAHYAAQSANVSVVQCLIDKGLSPWCRTATQETLLHKSCLKGQLKMTEYLLEKYPKMINKVDNDKDTAAHYAALGGNVSILKYLIDKGLNPLCRAARQETLLHRSCIAGQMEMTEYLLEKYPNMINAVDNSKQTPAHYAALGGNISILKYLIDKGLNPWCRTAIQETLLHKSCAMGHLEMTQYLLDKYPNMINEVDNEKRTPAHYAARGRNVYVLQYVIDRLIKRR